MKPTHRLMSLTQRRRMQGAATLVVVMVMFFIMAMLAAYASRNLMFEQRIASNYYRTGVAVEAADAGVDWALSMLNGLSIDGACQPAAAPATSFRTRYVNIAANSTITPVSTTFRAGCVRDAEAWTCRCPSGSAPTPNLGGSDEMRPSFAVKFANANRPGALRIRSEGCSSAGPSCDNLDNAATIPLGKSMVNQDVALVSALKTPPATALTAKGDVDLGNPGLGLHNPDPATAGLVLQTGGSISGQSDRISSLPGSPSGNALIGGNAVLQAASADRLFQMHFGMLPRAYRQQPAARVVDCGDADCGEALLAAYGNGARLLWIEGAASITSNITLGSDTDPVVLIVNGALTLDGPMLLHGLVYSSGAVSWTNGSGLVARINGALVTAGQLQSSGAGPTDIWYRADVLTILSRQRGSFVRIPGGWWEGV
jgi:Tfp pilus assembly protein PilX